MARTTIPRAKYAKIPLQTRQKLIKLVLEKNKSISKAGKRLSIKSSTAKLIVKKYKETGTFFVKKVSQSTAQTERLITENSQRQPIIKMEEQIRKDEQSHILNKEKQFTQGINFQVQSTMKLYFIYPFSYFSSLCYF